MAAPGFKPPPFSGDGKPGAPGLPKTSSHLKPVASGSGGRRPPKRTQIIHHSQDDGEGNWLVSYADMMTLLFGFFVMISAFSVPDAGKMEALKKETAESMGGKYTKPFEQISNSVQKTLADINLSKEVSVTETDEGVTIVSKGTLFFESGSTVMRPEAANLMDKISNVLAQQAKDFRIIVEGHTDDSPISTKELPSNWELSSIRAGAVIRLLEAKGIPRKNLRPMGLADIEPISPNRDAAGLPIPANQAENRRIVIRVQKQLPKRMSEPGNKGPTPASTGKVTPLTAAPTVAVPESIPTPVAPAPINAATPLTVAPSGLQVPVVTTVTGGIIVPTAPMALPPPMVLPPTSK